MKSLGGVRWLLAALIAFGLIGWALTGEVLYARLVYLGLLLLASAWLWMIFSLRGIKVSRQARILRASVGEVFEETFEVNNSARRACLWLEITNASPLPRTAGSRLLTGIGGRQKRFYPARTWLTRRGAFPLGPTIVASGDPFGLFTTVLEIPARNTLVVLPMTFSIPEFPAPAGLLPGGKTIRQRTLEVTPHAAGVREYLPSDPMKRIHWPSTARRGKFMVKEFEQDPQAEIWLFLDAQRDVHMRLPASETAQGERNWWFERRLHITLPDDTFEYAISLAGSLARYFLMERRSVGLACIGQKLTVVPAERGERQIGKILETLAFLEADGDLPLYGLVTMQAKLLPLGSNAIMITPSLRPDILLAVDDLQRRSLRPTLVLVKSETFGGAEGSAAMTGELLRRSVPVCPIERDADLANELGRFAAQFRQPRRPLPVY